jgi:hypothetical protein
MTERLGDTAVPKVIRLDADRVTDEGSVTDLILTVPTEVAELYVEELEKACERVAERLKE